MSADIRQRLLMLERERAIRLCRKRLAPYTRAMWGVIEPSTPYKHGWHIDAIAEHLEAVKTFEIKKLCIMTPPRHMKSIEVSVMFPSWCWLDSPWLRFIYSSYAASVSLQDSIKCREVIRSDRYRSWFNPEWELTEDQDTKTRFRNTKAGERVSTSVDGISTGLGGDIIVGDDLISAKDYASQAKREEAAHYWLKVLSTRKNNPERSARVLIMQRLHEKDPAGQWLAEDKTVEVLRLPAEYDPKLVSIPNSRGFVDPRTEPGELLWKEHFNREALDDLKKDLGSQASMAQLQQDPRPSEGGMFKREWWKRWKETPVFHEIVQFWDCAQKVGVTNDHSVCATWGRAENGFYLIDLWRGKVEAPELERLAVDLFNKWTPNAVVIEDKSSGSSLIQNLQRGTTLPIIAFNPKGDKVVRASAATPTVEAGNCYLPSDAPFVETFINEHERFPLSGEDDQVDTTSMMREYFLSKGAGRPRVRSL